MHDPFGKARTSNPREQIALRSDAWIEERWRMVPVRRPSPVCLRDYRYVDEARIDSYLAQLDAVPRRRKRKKELSLNATGPKALWSSEEDESPLPLEDRIDHLLNVLTKKGMVTGRRPDKYPRNCDDIAPLVHEVCEARQFIFSGESFRPDSRISALKLWVSEPDDSDFRDEMFEWTGSYLFLTEVYFDNLRYSFSYPAARRCASYTTAFPRTRSIMRRRRYWADGIIVPWRTSFYRSAPPRFPAPESNAFIRSAI